ncbi:nucleotidyltransferase family protein [Paenibacillus pasadenensis]|uniref:nucleotidyltransferase family protein n=1 Tax=Paenibacillus TaxID=44249 RepID=UPI00069423A9|nr:nucleotidyltransferase domain-containing protein [Paenibacillus pasadenensis]
MRTNAPSEISSLTSQEKQSLVRLKQRLAASFRLIELILFGSKARGDHDEWSDLDVLVLVEDEKNWRNRELLSDIVYELNLQYGTHLTCILENADDWRSEETSIGLPLKDNIVEEGIVIAIP